MFFLLVARKGNPPPPIPTEPPVPAITTFSDGFRCNFDRNMCGMTQDKVDDIDFERRRGSTRTSRTGPTRDHTSGRGRSNFKNLQNHFTVQLTSSNNQRWKNDLTLLFSILDIMIKNHF